MSTALIFNIQRFSVHDGPGIRTTIFFKGCPLRCIWCHNPESLSFEKQLMFDRDKCGSCEQCVNRCSEGALRLVNGTLQYNAGRCSMCGSCIDFCANNAREVIGKEYSVAELMVEIEKDRPFYEQSGGGVTLSGGEAIWHIDFIEELITACKQKGISVVLDTCGYAPWDSYLRVIENVDVFLYDIKHMDASTHQIYTGVDNQLILENLQKLSEHGAAVILRLPLIADINTTEQHIQRILQYIQPLRIRAIDLLPYHEIGKAKYRKLQLAYPECELSRPTEITMEGIRRAFQQAQYNVTIGGM